MRFPSLTPDVDLDYLFKAKKVTFRAESHGDAQSSFEKHLKFLRILKGFEQYGSQMLSHDSPIIPMLFQCF